MTLISFAHIKKIEKQNKIQALNSFPKTWSLNEFT